MNSYLVNTNLFLRFITQDLPSQAELAKKRFEEAREGKIKLEVTPLTIAEILFVLQGTIAFSKEEAVEKTIGLMREPWITIEHKRVVIEALQLYRSYSIDFIDLLTFALARTKRKRILSFDRDYDKLTPKLREEP